MGHNFHSLDGRLNGHHNYAFSFFPLCVGAVKKILKKNGFFLIFGPASGAHGWYSHEFHSAEIPTSFHF